jgi:predicted small lipoprotein YifL
VLDSRRCVLRVTLNSREAAMKVASVLVASLCCLAVAGCTLKGPELRVKPPVEVKVEGGHHDHDRGGKFCPPGQAKKGRC